MGLSDILSTARDALAAQQYGLGVAGQNVANVSTPGYARREALLSTQVLGPNGGTVKVDGTRQVIDQFTEHRLYATSAQASGADQRNTDLASVEALFNDGQNQGISDSLQAMFDSFSALASNPTDVTARSTALNKADAFAQKVSSTADSLASFQTEELNKAKGVAAEINTKASGIADLSTRITAAQAQGQDAADLIDQRTQLVTGLSDLVDVHAFTDGQGQLVIQSSGTTLVEGGTSRQLSIGTDTDGTMTVLASSQGGPATDVTKGLTGGKLGGIRDARDVDAKAVMGQLDQLAYDIGTAVNTQHAAGYGQDGTSGRNLFSVTTGVDGAARSLALDPDMVGNPQFLAASGTVAGGAGDSTNANALAALGDAHIAGGGNRTAIEAYSDIVGDVGLRKQSADSDSKTRDAMKAQVSQMRESASGVNLDEEMVSLTKFQRAYEAASKVLTTADQMLGDLMSSLRP
ncbi:MAG TPA: flagellar hook-associated protein FlgK [Polyangiaceae bacterium]|nr:flagellar hook-associated protein FlgK [Polyangiaceae bacterium]